MSLSFPAPKDVNLLPACMGLSHVPHLSGQNLNKLFTQPGMVFDKEITRVWAKTLQAVSVYFSLAYYLVV